MMPMMPPPSPPVSPSAPAPMDAAPPPPDLLPEPAVAWEKANSTALDHAKALAKFASDAYEHATECTYCDDKTEKVLKEAAAAAEKIVTDLTATLEAAQNAVEDEAADAEDAAGGDLEE